MTNVINNHYLISKKARDVVADVLGYEIEKLQIKPVSGGYSRNRRSVVGRDDTWVFVKEVDTTLLPNGGKEEKWWLKKDNLCVGALNKIAPEFVPEWSRLELGGHVLIMPAYIKEDGWLWQLPKYIKLQNKYIEAVLNVTKKLETVNFKDSEIKKMQLQPYFRDKIGYDEGFDQIIKSKTVRNKLLEKFVSLKNVYPESDQLKYDQVIILFNNKNELKELKNIATNLTKQPNDCFGLCDVRSDNIAYNTNTGQIKLVDWNWASFTPKNFGSTEFLIDMARQGVDIKAWFNSINIELLVALIGYWLKSCINKPLAPGNNLRDMQAISAANALSIYNLIK